MHDKHLAGDAENEKEVMDETLYISARHKVWGWDLRPAVLGAGTADQQKTAKESLCLDEVLGVSV